MSFIGAGPEDWPELDLDSVERSAQDRLDDLLRQHRPHLEREVGADYRVERVGAGRAQLSEAGAERPALLAQVTSSGRLLLTPLEHRHDLL